MNYVFFGTPEFAEIILERLIDAGMPPVALVCNPDRPVGRDKTITPPPTKKLIQELGVKNNELGIKVFQPETKDKLAKLRKKIFKGADLGVVASYGQIIPQKVIEKPQVGIIGVHPSLLPRFRGPSPIQSVILSGDIETGITLFLMDDKVDHGPIIASRKIALHGEDYVTLLGKLAELSAKLLIDTLPQFRGDPFFLHPQNDAIATKTRKFSSEDAHITPGDLKAAEAGNREKATIIERKIRALNPEPGVYTFLGGKRTKLLGGELKDGKLVLTKIQREGKKPIEL